MSKVRFKEEVSEGKSKAGSSASISERLKNVEKLNYDSVKGNLKEHFNNFMKKPGDYGVEDSELAGQLQEMGSLTKHYMWKQFKKAVKIKMNELAVKEAASAFIIDFEQDEDYQLTTIEQLEKIIADPTNKEYALEDDMIKYIKSDEFDKEKFINQVIKLDDDLEPGAKSEEAGFGARMLNFLKGLWMKVAPLVDKIMDSFVDLGAVALKDVLDKHVPETLEDEVEGLIDAGAAAAKELDEVATTAIEAHEAGEDVSEAAKDHLEEIGEKLAEEAREIAKEGVKARVEAGMDAITSAIGEATAAPAEAAPAEAVALDVPAPVELPALEVEVETLGVSIEETVSAE